MGSKEKYQRSKKKQNSQIKLFFVWFFLGVITIFCTYVSWNSIVAQSLSKKIHTWPSVPGKVLSRKVTSTSAGGARVMSSDYLVSFRYQYSVNGRDYIGKRYNIYGINKKFGLQKDAIKFHGDFPKGKAVDVFYKPSDPSYTIINRDVQSNWRHLFRSLLLWLFPKGVYWKYLWRRD